MRLVQLVFPGVMPGLILLFLACQPTSGDDLGEAVQVAIRKVEASIVRLRVIGGEQSIDGDAVRSLDTTGIVISEDGEILTSQFALEGNPEAVLIEDQSGKRTNATILATDSVRRIVLLKAKDGRWTPAVTDHRHSVEVGHSVQVGQWSIALGRFYAAESTSVSVGIISALNRIHGMAIQTDAKVSPVNYGGPLVTLDGRIAGILVPLSPRGGGSVTSGIEWYDSGIGFAVPLKDALASAEKLRSGQNLKPGRIGIRLVSAGVFDADVVIDRVLPGGPAERAGLLKGDRILAIDSQIVERNSVLMESLATYYAGDLVTMTIQRGKEKMTLTVELVESLPRVSQGYLGLLPIRIANKDKASEVPADATGKDAAKDPNNNEDGEKPSLDVPRIKLPRNLQKTNEPDKNAGDLVPLIVVNDSPTAAKNVPARIEVMSLNAASTTSLAELAVAVDELVPGSVAKIEYRVSGETTTQTAEITAATRPATVVALSDVVLEQIQKSRTLFGVKNAVSGDVETAGVSVDKSETTSSANDVVRREFNFAERGRCVVLSSPHLSPVMPGMIILLSAHDTSEEEIVRSWGPVLKSHCLTVAIPQNVESSPLTLDDIPLVMTTTGAPVSRSGADPDRVVVVADHSQSSLAWQCTFGGPSTIRGIALTDGWFSSSEIQNAEGSGLSVLLLNQAQGTQPKALRELCQKSLTDAGVWAPLPAASDATDDIDENRAVRCIADWSLLMRSF